MSYVTNHAHVNRSLASSLVGPAPWWFGPWPISFPAGFPRTDIDPGGEQFRTTDGLKRRAPTRKRREGPHRRLAREAVQVVPAHAIATDLAGVVQNALAANH